MKSLLSIACFARALNSALVLTEIDESGCKTSPVRDACEQKLRSLIELVLETLLSNLEDIGDVGHAEEVFHIVQTIRLGICISQLGVDLRLADMLPCHLQVPNKVFMLACAISDLDDFREVGRILSLDVGIWTRLS